MAADTPFGWYYYDVIGGSWSWKPGLSCTCQGSLFKLTPFEVLNISGLSKGTYTFYFGVDLNMNCLWDDSTYYDSVVFNAIQCNGAIYTSQNLVDFEPFAECNPGGETNCPCSEEDVRIESFENYGEVTSNVLKVNTYVNAIGHKKFIEIFPNGAPIILGVYKYTGRVKLPVIPSPDVNQSENPQSVHMMIQLWDGRNAFFPSNKTTLEGAIYWDLNPWIANYKIKACWGRPRLIRLMAI